MDRNDFKIISAGKTSWIFVSRLGKNVESADLVDHIKDICGETPVSCEELQPKFPGYRSYKIGIPYSAKSSVFNPDSWPKGVLVSSFVFPKNNLKHNIHKENQKPFLDGRRPVRNKT